MNETDIKKCIKNGYCWDSEVDFPVMHKKGNFCMAQWLSWLRRESSYATKREAQAAIDARKANSVKGTFMSQFSMAERKMLMPDCEFDEYGKTHTAAETEAELVRRSRKADAEHDYFLRTWNGPLTEEAAKKLRKGDVYYTAHYGNECRKWIHDPSSGTPMVETGCVHAFLSESEAKAAQAALDKASGHSDYVPEALSWSEMNKEDSTSKPREWTDIPQPLAPRNDPVNHPAHYTSSPSGIECIQVTEWMGFLLGNAVKYIWRAGSKGNEKQDLEKAVWYIRRRIAQIEKEVKK